MYYGLKQAADATGKTKTTILRAIQTGKISAIKGENKEWQIDPAELHRAYPPVSGAGARTDAQRGNATPDEARVLRQEIDLLREILAERDKRVSDKDAVITDLQERLDRETEERRRAHLQLTALLTDQSKKVASQEAVMADKRSLWRRLTSRLG
jgi:chromosome segregation ATPase